MSRILLVAYFYPPCSDTGAHRPTAMAKYLRRAGHDVRVLTTSAYGRLADDDRDGVTRAADAQLWRARLRGERSVDSLYDSDIYSSRPHPLSRVLVPEPLVAAWAPFARTGALRLHGAKRFDAVISTSPPESAHLVARALAVRGAAWVADVRDGWTFEPLRMPFPTALQRRLDRGLEERWLGRADVVTCVSRPAADDLRERGIAKPLLIPNGADPELLAGAGADAVAGLLDPERVSLVYTGRFGTPGRDPRPLVRALELLAASDRDAAARLELVVAGPLTEAEAELLRSASVGPARIAITGTLSRERALALQRAADALLLLAHARRSQLANFKLFEYLEAGPPILALAAGTEAGRIVSEAGGTVVRADDVQAIAAALGSLARGELAPPDRAAREAYAYPALAQRMSEAVELAIDRAAARSSPAAGAAS